MRSRWLLALLATLVMLGPAAAGAQPSADDPVGLPFRAYYAARQGPRTLGPPLTGLVGHEGLTAQYFEKGRLEDHRPPTDQPDPGAILHGRLTEELMDTAPALPVNATALTYAALRDLADPRQRVPAEGDGVRPVAGPTPGMFVPYDPHLRSAPGHIVPTAFWDYLNRADLFPGGWLHDAGLPMTPAVTVEAVKGGARRQITLQAFERVVLTLDPLNPPAWQVESGNLGIDAVRAGLVRAEGEAAAVEAAVRARLGSTPFRYTVQLQRLAGDWARAEVRPLPSAIDRAWAYARREGDGWRVVAGPGTAFLPADLDDLGVPAAIRLGNPAERTLLEVAMAELQREGRSDGVTVDRIDGEAARLLLERTVGDARPSYRFARRAGDGWRLLESAAYDAAYYVRHAIPRTLWLPVPPHAFTAQAAADRAAVRAALAGSLTTPPPGTRALQVVDLDVLELRRADYAVVVAVVDAEPDGSDPTWERGRQARWFALVREGAGWTVVGSSPARAPITP